MSTTNNTNVGLPSVGVAGNTGDKLILAAGTNNPSGTYPYSLGINTNSLWYSVPSGASHIKYVNGTAIATINSTGLTVTGLSLLNRITTYNNTLPDLTAVNNATTHSMINVFPGINGQQGALTADAYNIYLSSFAYGTGLSGPQPYITVNCTTLYNGSNTKLTLQAYGSAASGSNYNSKIIVNGGGGTAKPAEPAKPVKKKEADEFKEKPAAR